MSFFGTKFAALLDKGLRAGSSAMGGNINITLVSITRGTRTPGSISAGTNPTSTSVPCRGFAEKQKSIYDSAANSYRKVNVVAVLGASLPTGTIPKVGDRLIVDGASKGISEVIDESSGALYECVVT